MFSLIKGKIIVGLTALLAAAAFVIKILFMINAKKEHENMILKENAETTDRIHKDDVKREKFNTKQKIKAEEVNGDSNLISLAKKRGEVKDEDNSTAVND